MQVKSGRYAVDFFFIYYLLCFFFFYRSVSDSVLIWLVWDYFRRCCMVIVFYFWVYFYSRMVQVWYKRPAGDN